MKTARAVAVGDLVLFPWTKVHRIVKLVPYAGPLACMKGGQSADFDTGIGMTLEPGAKTCSGCGYTNPLFDCQCPGSATHR